jgi:hypothetical protein
MPASGLRFDLRDLAAAARESRSLLQSFVGNFVERAPVSVEAGLLVAQTLPSQNSNVDKLRTELDGATHALCEFGGSQRRSASEERIVN